MILTILLGGVIVGVDNLELCLAVGLLPMSRMRRLKLAAAFTVCETAAPLIGILFGKAMLSSLAAYARIAEPANSIV